MLALLVLVCVVLTFATGFALGARREQARELRAVEHHRALARWADHIISDIDVRPLLPPGQRAEGERLVHIYYNSPTLREVPRKTYPKE